MKIIICGGGTAGHVTPGIAIAEVIKENDSSAEIVFIGREGGEENEITKRHGYRLEALRISGFTRKITPMNVKSLFLALYTFHIYQIFVGLAIVSCTCHFCTCHFLCLEHGTHTVFTEPFLAGKFLFSGDS